MEKNFLILVEGRKDSNYIAKIFEENFQKLLEYKFLDVLGEEKFLKHLSLLKIKLKKDSTQSEVIAEKNPKNIITLSFDSINKEIEKHEINIYIKRAISQNVDEFTKIVSRNTSLKKYYNLDKELTYSYSIFDYDPGRSNIQKQIEKYFDLKNDIENMYPIINYPCIEGQDFHCNYNEIIENYEEILKDDNLKELLEKSNNMIKIDNELFYLKEEKDISNFLKKFRKQVMRVMKEKFLFSDKKIKNYIKYLENSLNEIDNIEILENQQKLYEKFIKKESEFVLISFIFSVFENICDWIIEEDEE